MLYATFLIKPVSSSCNMHCQYCFYNDVSEHRDVKNYGIMKEDVMKNIIRNIFHDHNLKAVHFAFQGGEPTLAGIDFYKNFINCVKKENHGTVVTYSIQSNGYILNQEWIELFKDNHFLVGISLDGYQENHDYFRLTNQNQDTFDTVMQHIQLLQNHHIEYNILTVLTKQLALHPEKVYQFYKSHDFHFIQFIPCLADLDSHNDNFALTPEYFYQFYRIIFELWKNDIKKGDYMSIGLFDNLISLLNQHYPQQCGFVGQCQIQYVIESQGDVYPCDFYVLDEYCLGNGQYDSFADMLQHPVAQAFLNEGSLPNICHHCRYQKICYGQCKRQRETFLQGNYCGYQNLLDDILQELVNLMTDIYKIYEKNSA